MTRHGGPLGQFPGAAQSLPPPAPGVNPPDSGVRLSRPRAPSPAGRSAAARAVREAFPEATWGALRKTSARSWEYDPDGKRILVRDPADPAAALRAAGAHADLQHLGDASGLMLHRRAPRL